MDLVLQLLFTGIGIGAVYALVALGFVLIFRATNVVNFAQGEFSMVAAYLMVVCVELGLPYWLSFVIALAGMALLGVVFNLGVYYPLRHRTYLPVIIATIGASILLSNSVLAIYGPQPQVLQGWFDTPGIQLGPVYLDSQYLLIIGVTILLVLFNFWFFEKTLLGKKLQATSQDKEMASLLGISVSTMIMITFIYSAVLGGLAGILVAPVLFVSIQMGSTIALKAFAATIIGGFGDVAGAIVGGLALGVLFVWVEKREPDASFPLAVFKIPAVVAATVALVAAGIAQGSAQALLEEFVYDADGNPLTGNFADYGFPSAAEVPSFVTIHMESPSPMNDLGAKGIGESGTIGATPAVQNAVVDAVSYLGVRHIDMPCTAERVWQAIQSC